jgi:hypothetical protein
MAQQHADALLVTADPENLAHRRLIIELMKESPTAGDLPLA